ncbi:MAG: indole-3-glycerol phosphate synthase TrpC [Dehalococcoidia bacterium]
MILDEIVKLKKEGLARSKLSVPVSELEVLSSRKPPPLDFASALQGDSVKLIAEIKRASPSKGPIRPDLDAVELARTYAQNGAAAISVLTEERFFQGTLEELSTISEELQGGEIPLLRKDFIFDPYQIHESRAFGADALLLIVAILSSEQLGELLSLSHNLGMQCLVEVHNEAEVESAILSGANIIGINNRDLKTFTIDLTTTKRLRPMVPPDRIVVSESGIENRGDVQMLREWGVDAILVGEALVAAGDVARKMRELL